QLLGQPEAVARGWVVGAMLAEARRLFATTTGNDTQAVHDLIGRTLILQSHWPEASSSKGPCPVPQGATQPRLTPLSPPPPRHARAPGLWRPAGRAGPGRRGPWCPRGGQRAGRQRPRGPPAPGRRHDRRPARPALAHARPATPPGDAGHCLVEADAAPGLGR